ncbi:MAG: MFS transporter [Candidatus Pacebacteria bacterium]|nr:MFS transporter [Candidatus Paceibacterota bacterium]
MTIKLKKILKYLILADLAFWSGCGLVSPVFAIFIDKNIIGGSAVVAGIAFGIYWTVKSLLQYPIGLFLDNNKGDKDDYVFLIFGFLTAALIPAGYALSTYPWQIYILQFFYGVSMAMAIAGWRALFTRNIDKGMESSEWCLDEALLGFGQGFFGLISGLLVFYLGFQTTFFIGSFLGVMSVLALLELKDEIGKDKGIKIVNIIKGLFSK